MVEWGWWEYSDSISMPPIFFPTFDDFHAWLEGNHHKLAEAWIGYYKRGTGRPSLTWPQSVDAALCFGWIDGVRKSIDDERYMIRFTPRKAGSTWSAINIGRVAEMEKRGLLREPGRRAFEGRAVANTNRYSYEQRDEAMFDEAQLRSFREDAGAWAWWEGQPPWYRRTATFWVKSAKQPATEARRLGQLIADCAAGVRVKPLRQPGK